LARWLFDTITGPGVQERIKKAAAMPVKFPGDDGILFDPKWQDDIIAGQARRITPAHNSGPPNCCDQLSRARYVTRPRQTTRKRKLFNDVLALFGQSKSPGHEQDHKDDDKQSARSVVVSAAKSVATAEKKDQQNDQDYAERRKTGRCDFIG
jgi:hypothetical protein